MYNVVTPDVIIEQYGADTLRLYEIFLGPLEISKPWDTSGIEGVYRFLKKLWRLFYSVNDEFTVTNEKPTAEEQKVIHKTIKKIKDDIEKFSFNTSVSAFMICVNELYELKCNKKVVLENLVIILSPFAPHVAEELWEKLGNASSVTQAKFPNFDESYLIENTKTYPVSFNGKVRFNIDLPAEATKEDVEKTVMALENTKKWLDGNTPKKVIVVPGRIINIVI
jgi:leucyl-tRNA synthetase